MVFKNTGSLDTSWSTYIWVWRTLQMKRKWYQQDLNSHFQDICIYETTISLFSMPLKITVETVPAKFQIDRINLQCDMCPGSIFQHVLNSTSTNSCLPAERFPLLGHHSKCQALAEAHMFVKSNSELLILHSISHRRMKGVEHWWMMIMEKWSARRQTYSSATLSIKNDTCIGLGLKPGLHSNNLVINHFSHSTVNPLALELDI